MNLGENLRKIRKSKGLSQRELAERISSDPSYVNRVEIGKLNPSIAVIERIADVLECSLDYLVKGINNQSEIFIHDKALVEKIRLIDSLEEKDRFVLNHMIDTMLTKKRMRELLDGNLNQSSAA